RPERARRAPPAPGVPPAAGGGRRRTARRAHARGARAHLRRTDGRPRPRGHAGGGRHAARGRPGDAPSRGPARGAGGVARGGEAGPGGRARGAEPRGPALPGRDRVGAPVGELLAPFEFPFFRNGVVVATVAGALCGLIGTYVVLRRMSYLGHGLSHAVFGGAAAASVLGVNFYLGAGVWGVAAALAIGRIARRRVIGGDAAIGVVTTASFALGLVLFGLFGRARRSPDALLFGSPVGVDVVDVWIVVALTVATGLVVAARYRDLLFATFDPEVADVSGVRTARVDALVMVVLA